MAFDWKKKLKQGFEKVVKTYTALDDAVEKKKNDAINALENKISTAGRKKKDAAEKDAPAAPETPKPETPKQ